VTQPLRRHFQPERERADLVLRRERAPAHPLSHRLHRDGRAFVAQVEFASESSRAFGCRLRALQAFAQAFAKPLFFIAKRHGRRTVASRASIGAHYRFTKCETYGYRTANPCPRSAHLAPEPRAVRS